MFPRFLKSRTVFLIGFGVGFLCGLLFHLKKNSTSDILTCRSEHNEYHRATGEDLSRPIIVDTKAVNEMIVFQNWFRENWPKEPENVRYDKWLEDQNVKTSPVSMDRYFYAPTNNTKVEMSEELESSWLKSKVHITCVIFTEKLKLAKSIKATWGTRCNEVYFFGQHLKDSEIPVIKIEIKLVSSWQLLCEAMNHIWNVNHTLEWIIFVKDDTMVIPENLRYMVAPLSHEENHYLGHPVVMWGQPYNIAQSGYVLSKAAFQKIIETFNSSEKCISGGKYWKKEDYYLGKHLSAMGIHPSDTRDQHLRGTFHGYSLQNLLWGITKPGSYWTRALYPTYGECCSPRSVTFSAGEADKMYTLDYMLYRLHVFDEESTFGSRRAPMTVPEEEVWKIALKEEFNMTELDDLSSDAYYKIWHSKYSEPQQLIVQNYQHMPEVLSSILTTYELEKSLEKSATRNLIENSTNPA